MCLKTRKVLTGFPWKRSLHQRYLVNPEHVSHIGGESVTVDDQKLPMSRNMKEEARAKLARAMLEGGGR